MAKVLSLKQALKAWFFTLLAVVAFLFGGHFSEYLISDPNASSLIRWIGVSVAVGSLIPWLLLMVAGVGAGDEYVRQVALVGTAIAFVANLLFQVGFNAAQEARLIGSGTHLPPLPIAIGMWLLGCSLALLYYRLRP